MKSITPAMRQYLDIKAAHNDAILFFRMGDFYEMFFEDARCASRILGIALTSRDRSKDIPMCGVPFHSASSYMAKLVKEGYKVAVCEQVEDPDEAKGIVERAVVKIVTPGITLEDEILDPKANNYIAAAFVNSKACGFAYMDVSTGEFKLTELAGTDALNDEIKRIRPLELLVQDGHSDSFQTRDTPVKKITPAGKYDFDYQAALGRLNEHFGTASLDGFGCQGLELGTRAAGALLYYIRQNQKAALPHIRKCVPYRTGDYLAMDNSTRRNLEIMQNMRSGGREGTLLELLDRTKTSMGGRRLKSWLLHPLKEIIEIKARQNAIDELIEKRELRVHLQELLAGVYDLERLIVRVTLKAANPRDLVSLKDSLLKVPALKGILRLCDSSLIFSLASSLDAVDAAAELIAGSLNEPAPFSSKDGGVIRQGHNADLDGLRKTGSGGKDWIARLEAEERAKTGINSLKVGYNRVFGYYIEVTNSNKQSVPAHYTRKQTLVNAERFVTPELKEWEERILTAEDRARELEARLFEEIRESVAGFSDRIHNTAGLISILDALASLAQVSQEMSFVKPSVNDEDIIDIEGGRHPVVEAQSADGFVANDLFLDNKTDQVIILTGPNMAGKSTYLRQNALIVLMAQIGSFVPAARATIGIVDRIFTRVGASDDLSRGQSTFMVEMNETANILNNATEKSLVILDEIGRGTSTFDGLSIAWAVVEHLHDHHDVRAKTIFATHYHELTELSLTKERVKNYNMAVKEWDDRIIFLRKVVPGGSNRSYGIQVARLAGIPAPVIARAREILKNLESGEISDSGVPRISIEREHHAQGLQMSLLGKKDAIRQGLKELDINSMTPLEALTALNKLKELLDADG